MVSKVKMSDTANSSLNVAETKFYEVDLATPCLFRILQTRKPSSEPVIDALCLSVEILLL